MSRPLFPFRTPKVIWAAPGAVAKLGPEAKRLGATRVLIITDRGLMATGAPERLAGLLAAEGIASSIYSDVQAEPSAESLEPVVALLKNEQADLVVGVGGGSAIDVAKAAALLAANGGTAYDYFGTELVKKPGLPVIAIPTTAGTGAEATPNAIFTDTKELVKKGIISAYMMPEVAIVDAELTLTVPARVTAATGMDALTHAIESYTSVKATPMTDLYAAEAIRLIGRSIRTAVFRGSDIEARSDMALGSLNAGFSIANAGTGAVHAMAYPLGGQFHVPHGIANAALLPYVLRWNVQGNVAKFAQVAALLGEKVEGLSALEAAERAVAAVARLSRDLGIPEHLSEFGVKAEDLPAMAAFSHATRRLMDNNPRNLTLAEVEQIYREAL
ncbi:MAG TPA: iron-containing alcohol dehydrogenase [Symbiobacteriaceae bacterium]|nr:iron-containing alcohol dehydrogenase [Symbiobacteriaceae bacterium]